MNTDLKFWVAESESWKAFVEFSLRKEDIADYQFVRRVDDYYIGLVGRLFEILKSTQNLETKQEFLDIARGLEIFSRKNTKSHFSGISGSRNALYVSSLYYLAGYPASSYLVSAGQNYEGVEDEISKFLSQFLARKLNTDNEFSAAIFDYLKSANINALSGVLEQIRSKSEFAIDSDAESYLSSELSLAVIEQFTKSNIWSDLAPFGTTEFWKPYVELAVNRTPPVWDFFPSQRRAIENGLFGNASVVLQMPTSAGKTAISELLIYHHIKRNPGHKVLFIAPFRALAAELRYNLARGLSRLGIKTKSIYGGNIATQDEKAAIEDVDLLITTPEKFIAIENVLPDVYRRFSTIICDEGHLIDDRNRGLSYELILSRFKQESVADRQFVFISAIVPNVEEIGTWLDTPASSVVKSTYRPTELNIAIVKERPNSKKTNYFLDVNPYDARPKNYQLARFITDNDFKYTNPKTNRLNTYSHSSKKSLSVAVALKATSTGTVALFVPQKGGAIGVRALANEALQQLETGLSLPEPKNPQKSESIELIALYFEFILGADHLLPKLVRHGIAYHHGDLPQFIREVIELAIRNETIRLVICTNTLAEGVNLPISIVVIHSTKRYDSEREEWVFIRRRDLKNIIGRAGRAGRETSGMVIAFSGDDELQVRRAIYEDETERVNGWLHTLLTRLTNYLKEKKITISNEGLDTIPFLTDPIDISIIDLLAEDVESEALEEMVQELLRNTFAYATSTENERNTLMQIAKLRGKKITPYIESGRFPGLKQSGASIRMYEEMQTKIDLENPLWLSASSSNIHEVALFLVDALFAIDDVTKAVAAFNIKNRTEFTKGDLGEVLGAWVSGAWYYEIAGEFEISTDLAIVLINNLIGYELHNVAARVIKFAEATLGERDLQISAYISRWPVCLEHGLGTEVELDLVELGFSERAGIIALREILVQMKYSESGIKPLRSFLRENRDHILERCRELVPHVAFDGVHKNMYLLGESNLF